MTKIQKIFTLLFCSFLCFACGKEEGDTPLPYISVDFPFVLENAYYKSELGIWPGAMKVGEKSQGYNYNGLILVRTGESTFRAYDATCTQNLETDGSSLKLSADKFSAVCPKCGTTYFIQSGGYSKDGKCRLQEYRVTYNPSTTVGRITN